VQKSRKPPKILVTALLFFCHKSSNIAVTSSSPASCDQRPLSRFSNSHIRPSAAGQNFKAKVSYAAVAAVWISEMNDFRSAFADVDG
jgi:hypothetical protein